MKFKKKYYITTAIAYPNAKPHLGHALEIIQTDAYARFKRLLGEDVFFQTGTDEHGVKNWDTAKKEGKEIMQFLDENVSEFKRLFKELDISYDNFIRTTNKEIHYAGSIALWKKLVEAGDIYKKKYKGLYCSGCEAFKLERELLNGKCENHPNREIQELEEENYFFKLSKYKDKIIELIKEDTYHVHPKTRKNEILAWLPEAKDISFSRPKTSLPWGITVPGDEEQVMYVWCDALSNYITGVGYGTSEEKFKAHWPADVHVIGKDILRFHAAFWPAMLLSAGIPLPKKLFVHGFVLTNGIKMSKSLGNVIEPFEQIDKYGVSEFRFSVLGSMPLDSDGDYTEEHVVERINTELVGNISNFCYRVLSFINKNFDSEIKEIDYNEVITEIEKKFEVVKNLYEVFDFRNAIDEILALSALGNKYMQDNEPWKLIKNNEKKAWKVLGTCLNIAKNLCILLKPVMPGFSKGLEKQLNLKDLKWDDLNFTLKNHKVNEAKIVIRKIEEDNKQKKIFPLNLIVGEILKAENHPDADKLLIFEVDIGKEKRQILAGLKDYYNPEEMPGKKVVVVSNLKYAKLRGVESQGMMLAGCTKDDSKVGLLTVKEANPGDKVSVEGYENSKEKISFDNFQKIKLVAKDGVPYYNDIPFKVNDETVSIEKVKDGVVR